MDGGALAPDGAPDGALDVPIGADFDSKLAHALVFLTNEVCMAVR
jgi:hypothetical protein